MRKLKCMIHGLLSGSVLGAALCLAVPVSAQDWSVDWHSIDGGGVIESETADQQWQLSGTIGQWDSSAAQALSSSGFRLTGGFWPINGDVIDQLFRDRFEALSLTTPQGATGELERPGFMH